MCVFQGLSCGRELGELLVSLLPMCMKFPADHARATPGFVYRYLYSNHKYDIVLNVNRNFVLIVSFEIFRSAALWNGELLCQFGFSPIALVTC